MVFHIAMINFLEEEKGTLEFKEDGTLLGRGFYFYFYFYYFFIFLRSLEFKGERWHIEMAGI